MRIGIIGLGNMAAAMIGGMLGKGLVKPQDIIGSCRTVATAEKVKARFQISVAESNAKAAEAAQLLILAVKPGVIFQAAREIREAAAPGTLVVSVAAGISLSRLKEAFGRPDLKYVRCMPNMPALVMEGCTGICAGEEVTEEELGRVTELMESFGKAYVVPERLMDVVVSVSGSAPAYVFMLIEAMADGAVAGGMPRKQAYEFAAQAVLGSARMVLDTGIHPGELKDMVCSPCGTTIQAVKVLEEKGLRAAVMSAMEVCRKASEELQG